jgi:hypothetical protein
LPKSLIPLPCLRSRHHRIGGTLEGCCLVEHVAAIAFVARLRSGCGEFLGALAICGCASAGDGLGHSWPHLTSEETQTTVAC